MATKSVLVVNTKTVRLTVDEMLNGGNYEITISDVTDVDGLHIAAGQNPKAFVGVGTFPEVSSVSYVNPNTIDVLFDKPMESTLLEVEGNYSIAGVPARTVAAATAQPDSVTARLTLNTDIPYGTYTYTATVTNVTDVPGNLINSSHDDGSFTEYVAPFRDNPTLETGLASYYKLDGDGLDAYTNGIDGTLVGIPTVAPTQVIGTALSFVGASFQRIDIDASPTILDTMTSVSVSAWVYMPAVGGPGVFNTILGRKGQFYVSVAGSDFPGKIYVVVYKDAATKTSLFGSTGITLGVWNHVVVTYTGTNINIYLNGAGAGTTDVAVSPMGVVDATNPWKIAATRNVLAIDGNTNQHSYMTGYIDEVGIWSKALSTTEVVSLYNTGAGLHF